MSVTTTKNVSCTSSFLVEPPNPEAEFLHTPIIITMVALGSLSKKFDEMRAFPNPKNMFHVLLDAGNTRVERLLRTHILRSTNTTEIPSFDFFGKVESRAPTEFEMREAIIARCFRRITVPFFVDLDDKESLFHHIDTSSIGIIKILENYQNEQDFSFVSKIQAKSVCLEIGLYFEKILKGLRGNVKDFVDEVSTADKMGAFTQYAKERRRCVPLCEVFYKIVSVRQIVAAFGKEEGLRILTTVGEAFWRISPIFFPDVLPILKEISKLPHNVIAALFANMSFVFKELSNLDSVPKSDSILSEQALTRSLCSIEFVGIERTISAEMMASYGESLSRVEQRLRSLYDTVMGQIAKQSDQGSKVNSFGAFVLSSGTRAIRPVRLWGIEVEYSLLDLGQEGLQQFIAAQKANSISCFSGALTSPQLLAIESKLLGLGISADEAWKCIVACMEAENTPEFIDRFRTPSDILYSLSKETVEKFIASSYSKDFFK